MGKSIVETLVGAGVLALAAGFLGYAYFAGDAATVSGYEVTARFSAVDGLNTGDDVRIGGVKVGSVVGMTLDPQLYQAIVQLSIDAYVELPKDTSAIIAGTGLLGGKYLAIEPGGADELITDGGEITMTQPSINLEGLLGKLIYSFSSRDNKP